MKRAIGTTGLLLAVAGLSVAAASGCSPDPWAWVGNSQAADPTLSSVTVDRSTGLIPDGKDGASVTPPGPVMLTFSAPGCTAATATINLTN